MVNIKNINKYPVKVITLFICIFLLGFFFGNRRLLTNIEDIKFGSFQIKFDTQIQKTEQNFKKLQLNTDTLNNQIKTLESKIYKLEKIEIQYTILKEKNQKLKKQVQALKKKLPPAIPEENSVNFFNNYIGNKISFIQGSTKLHEEETTHLKQITIWLSDNKKNFTISSIIDNEQGHQNILLARKRLNILWDYLVKQGISNELIHINNESFPFENNLLRKDKNGNTIVIGAEIIVH